MQQESGVPAIKPEFSKLAADNRWKLYFAALFQAKTEFIKEEVKDHPWKFPLYVAYMIPYAAGFGALWVVWGAVTIPALALFVKTAPTKWTDKVKAKISKAFNEESMNKFMEQHKACLEHVPALPEGQKGWSPVMRWFTWTHEPDKLRFRGWSLCKEISVEGYKDMKESYRFFRDRYFTQKPPSATPGSG